MKTILTALLITLSLFAKAGEPSLIQRWETGDLNIPESVLVVKTKKEVFLLVSQIDGASTEMDGKGGIAKLSVDGKILNQNWVTGLNAPKGMARFRNKLIVADLHSVVLIDITTAKVIQRIDVPDSVFLNDIAVTPKGDIFVSDTRTNKVHRIKNGNPEVYLENVTAANGLTYVNQTLYVAGGSVLWQVDKDKKLIKVVEGFLENADGVEMVGPNEFIVSCWAGIVYYVKDGNLKILLDTREKKKNTADIGWNKAQQTLYIPTFNSNSVVAYSLNKKPLQPHPPTMKEQ